jgi:hypothetical protein
VNTAVTKIEPAEQGATTILQVIERAARDPSSNIEKMERLLAMHERIVLKQAEAAFNDAMSQAQAEMSRISADAENPQTHSRYASYGQLDKYLRPIYTRHGFSLSFDEGEAPKPDTIRMLCHVSHRAGHTRLYHRDMPVTVTGLQGKANMTPTHGNASAQSYAMRYLVKAIFNVAIGEDDTDGNGPVECVNEDQVKTILAMLTETASDQARFLKYIKAKSIETIPASAYEGVIKIIEGKRRK